MSAWQPVAPLIRKLECSGPFDTTHSCAILAGRILENSWAYR
jgi:hypothetical protein